MITQNSNKPFFIKKWFPTLAPGSTSAPLKNKFKVKSCIILQNEEPFYSLLLIGAPRTLKDWETLPWGVKSLIGLAPVYFWNGSAFKQRIRKRLIIGSFRSIR